MSATSILLLCAPSTAVQRSASTGLARELSRDRAVRIGEEAKRLQTELQSKRPRHSLGVNVLLRYFEWDCALFLAAKREGVSEETAGRLVEEINWDVFASAVAVAGVVEFRRPWHYRDTVGAGVVVEGCAHGRLRGVAKPDVSRVLALARGYRHVHQ